MTGQSNLENSSRALTIGVDHTGLTVPNLEVTLAFFTDCLGWRQFGGDPGYPSAYVTDGTAKVTLWQTTGRSPVPFDQNSNIGLHHLAFKVESRAALEEIHERVAKWPKVIVEFSPEKSGNGPKFHSMFYEPGGIRLELSFDPR